MKITVDQKMKIVLLIAKHLHSEDTIASFNQAAEWGKQWHCTYILESGEVRINGEQFLSLFNAASKAYAAAWCAVHELENNDEG